ncbi:MAG: hypothetical protein A3K19_33140 [Lentisphaerae bacterium RIFOXYB12_FULL_65_16]|nr:MAG: hypothetical protein A3K18_02280 [Lentisphaerae bacterium RIFOXYA12_64_32]OGV86982.1 MAG: hypothetical protein A3K19_33140 [Lentisphaerae bacterium RIFOXYB12_FULL_65_16]
MHYYHALESVHRQRGGEWVACQEIAAPLHLDDSQVRRDLGRIGLRGHPRRGFEYASTSQAIRRLLGLDRTWSAVIIGLGRLGSALASYGGFSTYGLNVVGLFDSDLNKQGRLYPYEPVQHVAWLPRFLTANRVDIGIIAVPAAEAQQVADTLVAGNVKAIWNFAPTNLTVPPDVFVRNEHLSVGLGELMFFLKGAQDGSPPSAGESMPR